MRAKRAMGSIVLKSSLEWCLGANGDPIPRHPKPTCWLRMLWVMVGSSKIQHELSMRVDQDRHTAHRWSLSQLPKPERRPGADDPLGGVPMSCMTIVV